MRKILRFKDGEEYILAPITEEEFMNSNLFTEGNSEVEYMVLLRQNNWHKIEWFSCWKEGYLDTSEAEIIVELGDNVYTPGLWD